MQRNAELDTITLGLGCPTCKAAPGQPCGRKKDGAPFAAMFHAARMDKGIKAHREERVRRVNELEALL